MRLKPNNTPESDHNKPHSHEPTPEFVFPEPFEPFPIEALPEPVRGFVVEGARVIGCDTSYIILPVMSVLASAIGNTRRVALTRSWIEPAIVWTAIVGESGTAKSPAMDLALSPVRRRQHQAMKEHEQAVELHETALAEWKASQGKRASDPSSAPVRPVCRRTWTNDVTTEKLAELLGENPRGLLVARDELAGWLGGFDRYSAGKGADVAKWLKVFGGRALIIDRKGSGTTYVPRAAVSVTGGIQPGALRRHLSLTHVENGLTARLLFAMPPRTPKQWTDAEVSDATEKAIALVFDRLYNLEPDHLDGDDEPRLVRPSEEAKQAFAAFVNEHGREQAERVGAEAAAWSKLEGYAARLALVVHLARWAAGEAVDPDTIDVDDVRAALAMVRWFAREAERVYAHLDGDDVDDKRGELVELIRRKGGNVSARELVQASRRFPRVADAEAALDDLEREGGGQWHRPPIGPKGGRPARRFVLAGHLQRLHLQNPSPERANGGSVDVDS